MYLLDTATNRESSNKRFYSLFQIHVNAFDESLYKTEVQRLNILHYGNKMFQTILFLLFVTIDS